MRVLLPPIALAACTLLSGPLRADTASRLRTLDECLAKLGHEVAPRVPAGAPQGAKQAQALPAPAGIEELRLLCPDIEQAIIDAGLSTQLPEHWQRWLDRSSIEDISQLLRRYQSPLPSTAPGVTTLYQVARTLSSSEQPHGWWEDFKAWLRKWLSPADSTESSWLNRWLSKVAASQLLLQALLYVLMGVTLVGTLWIVWRELKLARAGARTGAQAGPRTGSGAVRPSSLLPADARSPVDAPPLSLEEVERAVPREQPALLLRLLVQALLQSGRLVNDRPLTHRELAVRSGFDDAGQRERFERISLLAERLLYGRPGASASATATATATGTATATVPATAAMSADDAQSQISQALTDGRDLYVRWLVRGAPAA